MELYFAPLEGITTYTYRNLHAKFFGGCDRYYTPFINPSENEKISIKNLRDILPENNMVKKLCIQVLTGNAESFKKFSIKVCELGYDEVNINIGCPSGTVVHKGRGAGLLKDISFMDKFLSDVFGNANLKVSVKTRTGYFSSDEAGEIIEVYNKYPISLLTVHPRARDEFYNGSPNMRVFSKMCRMSVNPVCYNGDVNTKEDFKKIADEYKEITGVMVGRGAISNPALFREIKGGKRLTSQELEEFSHLLIDDYLKVLQSDLFTLQKLKEIWMYIIWQFPKEKKLLKEIKKSGRLCDFTNAIKALPELE